MLRRLQTETGRVLATVTHLYLVSVQRDVVPECTRRALTITEVV